MVRTPDYRFIGALIDAGLDILNPVQPECLGKLVFDIANNKPAALYQFDDDLAEQNNLIADPAHAERVQRMEKLYREITSKRSTPAMEQSP